MAELRPVEPLGAVRCGFAGEPDEVLLRDVAAEVPVAFEINGLAFAVMMASPAELEDFATGFALSEGLAQDRSAIASLDVAEIEGAVVIRMTIPSAADFLQERLRLRLGEGSCGLCGLRSIEEVLRPLPRLAPAPPVARAAIARALDELPGRQQLGAATGACHAAAACTPDGVIRLLREDVGRHNALDKLIGAMARQDLDTSSHFILLTARCSYELVEKTVRAGCATLVTISAPTTLAVERARAAGLTLYALARSDSALCMHDAGEHGMTGTENRHGL